MEEKIRMIYTCRCKNDIFFYIDKIDAAFGLFDYSNIICDKCGKNNFYSLVGEYVFVDEETLMAWARNEKYFYYDNDELLFEVEFNLWLKLFDSIEDFCDDRKESIIYYLVNSIGNDDELLELFKRRHELIFYEKFMLKDTLEKYKYFLELLFFNLLKNILNKKIGKQQSKNEIIENL